MLNGTLWIRTADALPAHDQAVRFLVEHHSMWMIGTYREGFFTSNWARHDAGLVQCWCPLDAEEPSMDQLPGGPA